MVKLPDLVLPQKDIDDLATPLENDLTALFRLMEEDALKLVADAQENGWTPEEFERELEAMVMGENRRNENATT